MSGSTRDQDMFRDVERRWHRRRRLTSSATQKPRTTQTPLPAGETAKTLAAEPWEEYERQLGMSYSGHLAWLKAASAMLVVLPLLMGPHVQWLQVTLSYSNLITVPYCAALLITFLKVKHVRRHPDYRPDDKLATYRRLWRVHRWISRFWWIATAIVILQIPSALRFQKLDGSTSAIPFPEWLRNFLGT